ncbi:hypothetical protein JW998_04445 [candidate division KSB1 bacterium]|nr:hypothetical protein [candidate division KSB1 bacterium]
MFKRILIAQKLLKMAGLIPGRLAVPINALVIAACFPAAVLAELPNSATLEFGGEGSVSLIRGDLTAAGLPGVREASIAWQDYDGDGDLDFLLVVCNGPDYITRVYRNEGDAAFRAVGECVTIDGVTTCEGDQSAGVQITSSSPIQLWVQNLTADITPSDAPGIDVQLSGSNGTGSGGQGGDGPLAEVHFLGSGRAIVVASQGGLPGISVFSQAGQGNKGNNAKWAWDSPDAGGTGGRGGDVSVEIQGTITTTGPESPGILAVSRGGNGGDGGSGLAASSRYGRAGGRGGDGGTVSVSGNQDIMTDGIGAHGIVALSQGGAGGNGGSSAEYSGGTGGIGGSGGAVTILGDGIIWTRGDESHGIYARSEGARGGNGGGGGAFGSGNGGAGGGHGGDVMVDGDWSILTHGNSSDGIAAYSLGGGGGKGGHGGWFGNPGEGGASGYGGSVTVNSRGLINTSGDSANGITAQSVGGYAGTGGSANGLVSFSANGGSGGSGGVVTVNNEAVISTGGNESHAIMAQSIGGGGGSGGGGFGLFYSEGGEGSAGGNGDSVIVTNSNSLTTTGVDSRGIFAQSIGGGGGNGGSSGGLASFGGRGSVTSDGGNVSVVNSGAIVTGIESADGDRPQATTGSQAIFAQSIGGGGGNGGFSGGLVSIGGSGSGGGDGGAVSVINSGELQTHDDNSTAIFAQSVGGGGGNGAGSGGAVSFGGSGSSTGNGGDVAVVNSGAITTNGDRSNAVFAQSIGGGGGNGGGSGGLFSFGGGGGAGGDGDTVNVKNTGDIHTSGADASAIFAQSIGGGGGNGGGSGSACAYISMAMGGEGGAGGKGDAAIVSAEQGSIFTEGDRSNGIHAQSVGGGGGNGGFAVSAAGGDKFSASVAIGGSGGDGGNGGDVEVVAKAGIATQGDQAHGILAESIGGGGGSGGFSVALSAAAGPSASFSMGGSGGGGGAGGIVGVTSTGGIATSGYHSYGILAQSIGGGGGNGGGSIAGSASGEFSLAASFGGSGGDGGNGNNVSVANAGNISTLGGESHGIFAQSVGGGGGSGGFSVGLSGSAKRAVAFSLGGSGGGGGIGGAVDLMNAGFITTSGSRSNAIFAQSIGGGGGNGGLSIAGSGSGGGAAGDSSKMTFSLSVSLGGAGGDGGAGDSVSVANQGSLFTEGEESHGIFAQSLGGGGGNGGFSAALSASTSPSIAFSLGGSGGGGGTGGVVEVSNASDITTLGQHSCGIFVQSIGGGGGDGGGSISASYSKKFALAASLGGSGGGGGDGSNVLVSNTGQVTTSGDTSHAIFAQSVGGGGGSGGFSIAGTISSGASSDTTFSLSMSIGGAGGNGGAGDSVTVANQGNLFTKGEGSHGIFAQSVGGGGGSGGLSVNVTGKADSYISLGLGGSGGEGGVGGVVEVMNSCGISTAGNHAMGILAQSVGGGGGSGGASYTIGGKIDNHSISVSVGGSGGDGGQGSSVDVDNSGAIYTMGAESSGILAQSVGGGGGNGGSSTNFPSLPNVNPLDFWNPEKKNSFNLGVSVGGSGGAAGNGGTVAVENSGDIMTIGALSHGIFAQSVGGGGGNGANGIIGTGFTDVHLGQVFLDDILTIWDPSAFGLVTVGGSGGANGDGSTVSVSNHGNIATQGYQSHGVFAQSVGGGGGTAQIYAQIVAGVDTTKKAEGGDASVGLLGIFSLGGKGGAAGDGGSVSITNDGSINTIGDGSYGILAQSVGGGGGIAGDVVRGLGDLNVGLGGGLGGDGTNGGDGGDVTVSNASDITTLGKGSIGIFAQSVGGGGGIGGGAGNSNNAKFLSFAGSAGGSGSGGTINVTQIGSIVTYGGSAHGIFAQSGGGETGTADLGGPVDVSVTGDILAYGKDAHGIMAQSVGSEGNGNITVDVTSGTVQGGTGSSAGILMLDGADNVITNRGTITTMSGVDGIAIRSTGGNETVDNFGIVTGSIDLGGGTNYFNNQAGSLFEAGSTINLGPDGVLTNDGTFSPGGTYSYATTTLNCDYVQTSAGTFEASVCGCQLDKLIVADGTATLGGTLKVLAECDAYCDGTTYDIIEGSDVNGSFSDVVLPHTAFLDFDMDYIENGVRLSVDVQSFSSAAGNPVENAIAGCMDSCLPDATGDMSQMIGAFQLSTPEQVAEGFATLSPDTYDNLSRGALQSTRLWQDALTQRMDAARSNPFSARETSGWMMYEGGNGAWLSGVRQGAEQSESGGYLGHNFMTSIAMGGYERSLGSSIIGMSIGTALTNVDRNNGMANSKVDGIAGSVYGGHLWGQSFTHGVISYAHESFENRRDLHVGPLERVARGNYNGSVLSALLTGGRRFSAGRWGFEPFASVQYAHLSEEEFAEKGSGSVNLIVESRTTNWLGSDLGIRLSRIFLGERSAFVPELLLSWNHDFGLNDQPIVAAFEGNPSMTFTINGQDIQRDGVTLGAGLSFLTTSGWKASLRYDRVQRSDYKANSLTIRLGLAF